MAFGRAENLVDGLADGADCAVANDGEARLHVHAGQVALGGRALFVYALVGQAESCNRAIGKERLGDRRAGPDLHEAAGEKLRCDPLVELPERKQQASALVEEGGNPGQGEGVVADAGCAAQGVEQGVGDAQTKGAAAGADGIEEVKNPLVADVSGERDFLRFEIGKAGTNAAGLRDHTADGSGKIVGALIADHLQRYAWRGGTLKYGIGGILGSRRG